MEPVLTILYAYACFKHTDEPIWNPGNVKNTASEFAKAMNGLKVMLRATGVSVR